MIHVRIWLVSSALESVEGRERAAVGNWNATPGSHEGQRLSGMPVL